MKLPELPTRSLVLEAGLRGEGDAVFAGKTEAEAVQRDGKPHSASLYVGFLQGPDVEEALVLLGLW